MYDIIAYKEVIILCGRKNKNNKICGRKVKTIHQFRRQKQNIRINLIMNNIIQFYE